MLIGRAIVARPFLSIGIGLAGAYGLARYLASLLFGVSAADPPVYAAVSVLLAFVSVLAIVIPSARATRVDPLIALRGSEDLRIL